MDSDVTGIVLYLLLNFLLIVAIAALIWRAITRTRPPDRPGNSALTLLEERFVQGEIDANDFQERRALIEHDR